MKSDYQIQQDVMEELKWEPILTSAEIGVAVKHGVVTLSGTVDSYLKKLSAEKAAKKIAGVKAIAEDIQIGVSPTSGKADSAIAETVVNALKWNSALQEEKIKIKVEDGVVRLEGEVEWDFQRTEAKTAIEHLSGVRSVINLIRVQPKVTAFDVKNKISAALHRSAHIDAAKIQVEVSGKKVTVSGKVRSVAEKDDVITAAWNAPGVNMVINKLEVDVPEYSFEE